MVNYERPATAETANRSKWILHVGTDKINVVDLPEKTDSDNYSTEKKHKTNVKPRDKISALIMSIGFYKLLTWKQRRNHRKSTVKRTDWCLKACLKVSLYTFCDFNACINNLYTMEKIN